MRLRGRTVTSTGTQNLWRLLRDALDPLARLGLAGAIAIGVACAVLTGLSPLALKHVVDGLGAVQADGAAGAGGGVAQQDAAIAWLWLYLLAMGGARLGGPLQAWCFALGDQRVQARLSAAFFSHVVELPLRLHAMTPGGAILQAHAQTLQGVRSLISLAALSMLPVCVQLGVMLMLVAAEVGSWLAPFLMVAAFLYVLAFLWGVNRATRAARLALSAQVEAGGYFADALTNAETIKNDVAEHRVARRYGELTHRTMSLWRTCHDRRAQMGVLVAVVFVLTLGAALHASLAGAAAGRLSAGDFVLVNACLLQMIAPVEALGYAVRDAAQAFAHAGAGRALLSERTEAAPRAPAAHVADVRASPSRNPPAIRFENVDFAYPGGAPALKRVDFDIPGGARIAVVGPSGAGKSTLLRLIMRHETPDAGRILVDGHPALDVDLHAHRSRIGVISQDVVLFNDTVRANLLAAAPSATEAEIARAVRTAQLEQMLARRPEGLDAQVGERGLALSGGERQRVALARALLRDTPVLLLDEATSALDPDAEALIADILFTAARRRTLLMVTHRLSLAARADRILVLSNGELIEQGGHAHLLTVGGAYARLWALAAGNASGGTRHDE